MQTRSDEPSLGDLFGELSRETSTLVRQEVALAKTEMTQTASEVGKDIGFLLVGGAVAYAGVLVLLSALVLVLAIVLPAWIAALIVGIVVAGIGYALVQRGLTALKSTSIMPQQTIETLKDDVTKLKEDSA